MNPYPFHNIADSRTGARGHDAALLASTSSLPARSCRRRQLDARFGRMIERSDRTL